MDFFWICKTEDTFIDPTAGTFAGHFQDVAKVNFTPFVTFLRGGKSLKHLQQCSCLLAGAPLMCLKRVVLCSSLVQTCRCAVLHVHPCFILHSGINVLHYRINASRVANYERFLFKRLFWLPSSVLTVLLNLHQRKSKCPCHNEWERKKK